MVCLDIKCDNKGALCSECINNHIGHQIISIDKFEKDFSNMVNIILFYLF